MKVRPTLPFWLLCCLALGASAHTRGSERSAPAQVVGEQEGANTQTGTAVPSEGAPTSAPPAVEEQSPPSATQERKQPAKGADEPPPADAAATPKTESDLLRLAVNALARDMAAHEVRLARLARLDALYKERGDAGKVAEVEALRVQAEESFTQQFEAHRKALPKEAFQVTCMRMKGIEPAANKKSKSPRANPKAGGAARDANFKKGGSASKARTRAADKAKGGSTKAGKGKASKAKAGKGAKKPVAKKKGGPKPKAGAKAKAGPKGKGKAKQSAAAGKRIRKGRVARELSRDQARERIENALERTPQSNRVVSSSVGDEFLQ